jgi:integrase
MRQGELLKIKWEHINIKTRTLVIPECKNGFPRVIPLGYRSVRILKTLYGPRNLVFPTTADAVKRSWRRLVVRAKIDNFHFHDLRHEAISRLFEQGLSLPEVALISGHRDTRMLLRYTIDPNRLAMKLR